MFDVPDLPFRFSNPVKLENASDISSEHIHLENTPLAILAAQCNKLVSHSPSPLTNATMGKDGKDFSPWKKGNIRKSSACPDNISHSLAIREREAISANVSPVLDTYQRPPVTPPNLEPHSNDIRFYQVAGAQLKGHHHNNSPYYVNMDSRGDVGARSYESWTPFNMNVAPAPTHTSMRTEVPPVNSFGSSSWWDMHNATTTGSWLGMPGITSLTTQHPSSYPSSPLISPQLTASHGIGHSVASPFSLGQPFLSQMPPSRAQKRYSGRATCVCPNCMEIEKLGSSGAHLAKASIHSCHIPGCGKVYAKSSHLKAHLRWHTNERTFVCDWLFCGKRFSRSDELQRHSKSHTADEEKFICPVCEQRFAQTNSLRKHMKTHNSTLKKGTDTCSNPDDSSPEVPNSNLSNAHGALNLHASNGMRLEEARLANEMKTTK